MLDDTIAHAMEWKILPKKSDDLIRQLLINRGIKTKKDQQIFFNPKIEDYSKETKIPGITKACQRIKKAIEKQELIIVHGDYDVDGICASAILYLGLTSIGAKVLPYIPHRDKEGYGLSKTGLDFARDSGAAVVITVDNGIVAFEQALYAQDLGLDLIITDHHLPKDKLPEAFVIIHSTKMCGSAVAWCLTQDLVEEKVARQLLQFVAIATVCDMMPLINLNRSFLAQGLEVLNHSKNLGLLSLISECGLFLGSIGAYEIGHILGPRLNAIGRLQHAIDGLRLLCTKDTEKAKKLARLLSETNAKRQVLTDEAVNEAKIMAGDKNGKKIQILHSPNWQSGIIGLIAARICEEYKIPAIAISLGESFSKGSARSVKGINIVEVIRQCSDILIDVGGHYGAAGFSIYNDKIDEFKLRMGKLMEQLPLQPEPFLEIEVVIDSKKITKSLAFEIDKFSPFGFGNPQPILASLGMQISDIKAVGEGKHLKGKLDGIEFIAFNFGPLKDILKIGQFVDAAFCLDINKFNGSEILQLKIKDIKLNSN